MCEILPHFEYRRYFLINTGQADDDAKWMSNDFYFGTIDIIIIISFLFNHAVWHARTHTQHSHEANKQKIRDEQTVYLIQKSTYN